MTTAAHRETPQSTWVILGVVVAAALGAFAWWALGTTSTIDVTTAGVTSGPITRSIAAAGTLEAVTTVEVGAQVSGNIQTLEADYNSIVHKNQVVARLDPRLYEVQLQDARASLGQARASREKASADLLGFRTALEDAQTKYTRAAALAKTALLDQADLDAAKIAVDEAQADLRSGQATVVQADGLVAQATAAVNQAEVNLSHTIIRSPIDGIVIDRDVEVGQTLASTMQTPVLFRIAAGLEHMQVQVDIDESDIAGITVGERVDFSVEAYPDERFSGTVAQVRIQPVLGAGLASATTITSGTAAAPSTNTAAPTVVSYTAIVNADNRDERLRPGMSAEVTLDGAHRDKVVRVPNKALTFRPSAAVLRVLGETEPPIPSLPGDDRPSKANARAVWVYDGKRLTPIAVKDGLADSAWTEILAGAIKPGDQVVTNAIEKRHRRL